jgi:hypothetical protein
VSATPALFARREHLESAVERAIELLNAMDGDCDLEPETDLGALEDEGVRAAYDSERSGPGCCVFDGV